MVKKYREETLSMVMAGGRGERLYPLTLERTKPSVPFGGKYRIIDFALSNLINSGIYSIYVLVQYKSQSLIEHIRTTWMRRGLFSSHFVTVVPPQMRREREWYRGTADSVYQNINLIYDFKPRLVAIFGGDHVYRMDIQDMVDFHLRKKAKLTLAVIPIDAKEAKQFGATYFDSSSRVVDFKEKQALRGEKKAFVSMGNYIFDADFLIDVLTRDSQRKDSEHDFGKNIIPYLVKEEKAAVYAYDFSKNRIPMLKPHESRYYWKDVGTIQSYWETNMDLLGEKPKLDLDNQSWPIYASNLYAPPAYIANSEIEDSLVCEGARLSGAKIKNSILGRSVKIGEDSVVEDSIILDFTKIGPGCHIKKAVIDRFNVVEKHTKIGYDKKSDAVNYYLDTSGIVVVKRGSRKAFYPDTQ